MLTQPRDDGRGAFQVPGSFHGRYDICPAAIADQAAVVAPEGFDDPLCAIIILIGHETIMHFRKGIEVGPLALIEGNLFPGFGAGGECVHRPPCGHCVPGNRPELPEYGRIIIKDMPVVSVQSSRRARIIRVGDEDVVAQAGIEHAHGVLKGRSDSDALLAQHFRCQTQLVCQKPWGGFSFTRRRIKVPIANQTVDIFFF